MNNDPLKVEKNIDTFQTEFVFSPQVFLDIFGLIWYRNKACLILLLKALLSSPQSKCTYLAIDIISQINLRHLFIALSLPNFKANKVTFLWKVGFSTVLKRKKSSHHLHLMCGFPQGMTLQFIFLFIIKIRFRRKVTSKGIKHLDFPRQQIYWYVVNLGIPFWYLK